MPLLSRWPRGVLAAVVLSVLALLPGEAIAQAEGEGGALQAPRVSIGTFLQFTGDFQDERSFPGTNGFRLDNARLRLRGELPGGTSASLQSDEASLLEARLSLPLHASTRLEVGLFKPALSGEYVTSSHSIDFHSRSQVVRALIDGREVGAQVDVDAGPLRLRAGVFNGDGDPGGNAEPGMMGVIRADLSRTNDTGDTVRVGASWSRDGDPEGVHGEGLGARFVSLRNRSAVDVRLVRGAIILSSEWMAGWARALPGGDPRGGHVTLGVRPRSGTELNLRWDTVDTGIPGAGRSSLILLGASHRPTTELRFLVNAVMPLEGPADGVRFLVRSQLYF